MKMSHFILDYCKSLFPTLYLEPEHIRDISFLKTEKVTGTCKVPAMTLTTLNELLSTRSSRQQSEFRSNVQENGD